MLTYNVMLVAAGGFATAMVMVLLSLRTSRVSGVREWLISNVLGLAALPLYSVGWTFQTPLVLEVANTLYGAAAIAAAAGFRRYFDAKPNYQVKAAALVTLFFTLCLAHYVVNWPQARVILTSLFHGAVILTVLPLLLTAKESNTSNFTLRFGQGTAVAILVFATFRVLLGIPAVIRGELAAPFDLSGPQVVFLTFGLLLIPAFTLAGSCMATSRLIRAAELEARIDALTGAWSRRAFLAYTDQEVQRSKRTAHPLSLLMIDVDNFKQINDSFGHPVGDQVLFDLANRITLSIRATDFFGRMGGEEFAVLMPETSLEQAGVLAERIRSVVAEAHPGRIYYTVSIGLATLGGDSHWNTLYVDADRALVMAKNRGKNLVFAHTDQT